MTNNPQAFPQHNNIPNYVNASGMTLRDYFAGQALIGLLSSPVVTGSQPMIQASEEKLSKLAYSQADAMLEARNREGKS